MNEMINKWTKSTVFILPLTFLSLSRLNGFINCYCQCENDLDESGNFKNRIYVLFPVSKMTDKQMLDLTETGTYLKHFYIGSKGEYVVFSFAIPNPFLSDFKKVMRGAYSLTTDSYKKHIAKTFTSATGRRPSMFYSELDVIERGRGPHEYLALNPTRRMKTLLAEKLGTHIGNIKEVISKPDMQEETFKISHLMNVKI